MHYSPRGKQQNDLDAAHFDHTEKLLSKTLKIDN